MQLYHRLFISGKLLYMFRVLSSPIQLYVLLRMGEDTTRNM